MVRWSLAAAMFWSTSAIAGEYYLESLAVPESAAADTMAELARADGMESRVVRRFRAGAGWQYVVIVAGFDDEHRAEEAAQTLAEKAGKPVAVYAVEGDQARIVDTKNPETIDVDLVPETPPAVDPEVARILEEAVRAHGGLNGGQLKLAKADRVKFVFRRTLPEGPSAEHIYGRRGSDVYLDTKILSGEGVSSTVWLTDAGAWLSASGKLANQEPARVRQVLAPFSPEEILAFPLGFAMSVAERREFQELAYVGSEVLNKREMVVLRHPRGEGGFSLWIDAELHLVQRVAFDGASGGVTYEFQDWRVGDGGLVLPRRIKTLYADQLKDEIELEELDLSAKLPEEWFQVPGG